MDPEASTTAAPGSTTPDDAPGSATDPAAGPDTAPASDGAAGRTDGSGSRSGARRSLASATTVAVLVVLVVVASAVGVLAFTTNDGASSPEEATRILLDAVRHNDLVGIVEQLPMGERKPLTDPVRQLEVQLHRLGLIGATDAHRVLGPTFTFDGVDLRTTDLAAEVKAVDLVAGRFKATWPGDGPPLTAQAREVLEAGWGVTVDPSESAYERDFARNNLRLVAIKEGGGWHVSLAYSAAEALRARRGKDTPELGKGPGWFGAERPERAVRDLVTAYADGNPERLVTLIYPEEGRALYDYSPAFLPEARAAAERAGITKSYDVQLNKLELAVEGTGSTRQVRITQIDLDIRDELRKQHLWWADGCFHTDQRINDQDEPFDETDSCSKDKPKPGDALAPRDNPVSALAVFGGGADLPTFTVIERNGRWFVSPVHTLVDSVLDTIEKLQPGTEVEGYAERLAASWQGGAGQGLSGQLVTPTMADVAADPAKGAARGQALVDACAQLKAGPEGEAITAACVKRLVDQGRVRVEDLPPAARALVG